MTCSTCRHWRAYPHDQAGDGECRRHAPLPQLRMAAPQTRQGALARLYVWWPTTHTTEGCGEFCPAPVQQEWSGLAEATP